MGRCHFIAACAGMLSVAFITNGCAGRTVNNKLARDAIMGAYAETLSDNDLQVMSIIQLGPNDAIAETQLHTAFRLQKRNKEWVVREVRVGRANWEKIDDILRALQQFKIDEAGRNLDNILAAIGAYRQKNGRLPQFRDYIELSDALYPLFLSPLIREDPWKRPLTAVWTGPDTIRILSSGPDGEPGTSDDIERTRTFSK
jgi:hypothetical protein